MIMSEDRHANRDVIAKTLEVAVNMRVKFPSFILGYDLVGWEDLGDAWSRDSDLAFLLKLAALSSGLAYAVKYAPALSPSFVADAWSGLPDEAVSAFALILIVLPTALNCAKWAQRSKEDAEFMGDF